MIISHKYRFIFFAVPRTATHALRQAIGKERFRQRILAMPQYRLLTDERDTLMMDYVGRYETLQQSFDEICRHIGIAPSVLGRRNESRHRRYACYYDASLQQAVADCYRKDFELFGYDAGKLAAEDG